MHSFLIAVLADTHVPDRVPALKPAFLDSLKDVKPDLIVHAGDICTKSVLDALNAIAPVIAVRGNRDFLLRKIVPKVAKFEQYGVPIAVMHGHIDFITYWLDKFLYVLLLAARKTRSDWLKTRVFCARFRGVMPPL